MNISWYSPSLAACSISQSQLLYLIEGYNIARAAIFSKSFSNSQNQCWPVNQEVHHTKKQGWSLANVTDFKYFSFSNFTYCLTLFSKFFLSFSHNTCSLLVSHQYLALDGIYYPFWAIFSNNSTLWECTTKALVVHVRDRILIFYNTLS